MSTYLLITPKEDELYHHGIKGQKWGVRRSPAELATASAGPGGGAIVENVDELEESINEAEQKIAEMKADGADEKEIRAMEASIKAGKEKVNQILDMERRMNESFSSFTHAMSFTPDEIFTGLAEDELFFEHHGIKGMKWGIRRFQPYRQGMKVAGGKVIGAAKKVKQRFKDIGDARQQKKAAKAKAKSVKKAQATRKANADYEAEKKKAIESGSIEDLAKFKGKLTNEEYNRAFLRLQNEQKVAAMVAANQKTVWDKVDKGMEIVARVSKYANTITVAKNNFDALNDALHRKEKEAAKEQATLEKNKFLTNIDSITELNRGMDKHKLTPQEYQAAMNILANKKRNKVQFGTTDGKNFYEDQDFVDQDKKAAKEKAAKERADRDRWNAEQNFKNFQKKQAKEAKRQEKAAHKQAKKEANAPKDGEWWEDKPSSKTASEAAKSGEQKTNQLLLTMKDNPPSASSVDTGKRVIKGFKSSQAGATYRQTSLNFGDSEVKKFLAKTYEPSKVVTDTRKTVADTQAEAARQREEADKKRKKAFGHSAIGSSDELYHHGIKGQKWGVRRFQNKDGSRTKAGKDRAKYLRDRVKASRGGIVDDTWKTGSAALTARTDSDIEQLTMRYVGGVPHYASPSIVMRDFLRDTGDAPLDYKPMKGFTSFDEADLSYVNPDWGKPGTTQNCAKCAVATELMRYGVAVKAGRQAFPSSADAMTYWFDGTEKVERTLDDTEKLLSSYGDGASGTIAGFYPNGAGGHAMHFSVSNGQVHVQDGQNGRRFNSIKEAAETYGFDTNRSMQSYRLDNATPNWEHMAEDSVIGAPRWQSSDDRWRAKSSAPFRFTNNSDGTISNYDLTQESSNDIFRRHYTR